MFARRLRYRIQSAAAERDHAAFKGFVDELIAGTNRADHTEDGIADPKYTADMIVTTAEAAIELSEFGLPQATVEMKAIATDLLRRFWISDPAKNQYYIRACYGQAVLDGVNAHVLKEPELVTTIMAAISHLERGLDLALEPQNVSRYGFLVYNASVHLWNIIRPLMRTGAARTLVPIYTKIIEALTTVDSDNYAWRVRSTFNLCRCLDDAEKSEEGLKYLEAAKGLATEHAPELLPWAYRLQMHLLRAKGQGAMVDVVKTVEPESGLLALPYIQAVRSLELSNEEVVTALTAAMDTLQGEGKPCEGHVDGQQLPAALAEAVVEVGRIAAATPGGKEIAERCVNQCYGTKDMRVAQMIELIRASLVVTGLGEDIALYTEHTVQQLTQAVVMVEKCLQMAIRADDGELVGDTCVVAWNFSLRLLQPTLRDRAKTVLHIAAEALEKLESPHHELRALLHLEMTKCELANELVKKADQHCSKSLSMDYSADPAMVDKFGLLRPLDRFLIPIKHMLDLKVSMYAQPERPEEKALLVVDQARPAKNAEVVGSLLDRAATMIADSQTIDPCPPPSESGTVSAECRERALLWASIAKIAWKSRLSKLARRGAAEVIKLTLADQIKDRDLVTLQGELAYIEGEAFMLDKQLCADTDDWLLPDQFTGVGRTLGHELWSDWNLLEDEWDLNTAKEGWLQMRMPPGRDIGSTKDATSRLYQECGHSILDVSTHLDLGGQMGIGGISVCSYADRDWMALKVGPSQEAEEGQQFIRWEHKGSVVGSVQLEKPDVYLRILKDYEDYTAYYRYAPEDEWTQMMKVQPWVDPAADPVDEPPPEYPGIISVNFQTPFEIGLFGGNMADEGEPEMINFENFEVVLHNELASRRFLHATRIGLQLDEEWMVRNGAIYCLNYNLPLTRLGRAHLFLPHWEELFEAFFKDDAKIAKNNLPQANQLVCVLAAALEQTAAIAKGGVDQEHGIEFGSGEFPDGLESSSEYNYVRGLRELLSEKLTNPELTRAIEVTTKMLALLVEPMRKASLLQLQTRSKCLVGQDLVKMADEGPAGVCRVLVLLEELSMKLPDAQAEQFLNKAIEELTAAETPAEPPPSDDPDAPVEQPVSIPPNSELWVGIAKAALRYRQYKIAETCSTRALSDSSGPNALEAAQAAMGKVNDHLETVNLEELELVTKRLSAAQKDRNRLRVDEELQHKWRWYSIGESCWGEAILGQIEPTRQDFGIQNKLSVQALQHFAQAAKFGATISNKDDDGVGADLILKAAKLCWNGAIPNMTSEISRRMLFEPLKDLVMSVMNVEEQVPVLTNDEAEELTPQQRFNYELKVSLYRLLLKCYEEKGDNSDGVQLCERALGLTPSKFQKTLWEAKMVMMSKLGRNVAGELARLKEANPVMQARMLGKLARSAKKPSEQISSLQKILVLLSDQPLEQVDYMIQLGECLFANSCPATDVQDQLLSAADILLDVEDDDSIGGGRGYDGSMAGSTFSGQTGATGKTNATNASGASRRSSVSRPTAGRRSSISRKPSVAGSAAGSAAGSSRKSGASGRTGYEEGEAAKVLNVSQLFKMGRIMTLLAMVAPTTTDALECAIQAQHYFSRTLTTHTKTKKDACADGETPLTMPELPTEWLAYPLEELDAIVSSAQELPDGNMMIISSDSVDAADHTVVCIVWAMKYLLQCNYLLLCLPLTAVFEVVTSGVLKRQAGVKVARIHAAAVLSKLGRNSMYTRVVESIGKVTIAKQELDQGRLEVQRRVQVKKTLEEEAPAADTKKKGFKKASAGLKGAAKMLAGLQRMGGDVTVEESKIKVLMSVSDRQLWVQMAEAALEEGWCQQAKQLVHEARQHADAFDDIDTTAWCDYLDGQLAYIGGSLEKAVEHLNKMRSKYSELGLWAKGTLLVAQIQYVQHLDGASTLTLESAIKLVERLLKPSSQMSTFGSPVLMAMVPEIQGWFMMEMAVQMMDCMATPGKTPLNDVNMATAIEMYGNAEACFSRAGNELKMIECMLSRANLMVKLPIAAEGYDCKGFLAQMVNDLCRFETSCKKEIAKYTAVSSSEVLVNPLTDMLANLENCLTQSLLILAYLEEQADNATLASMTVVDKFLMDDPDLTTIPLANKACFYAAASCSLQVSPKMRSKCLLALGQATAASYRKDSLDAFGVGTKVMEGLESELDRLTKALDEATAAAKAAAVKSGTLKFDHGEKKPKDLITREKAISKQKKIVADRAKKAVDEKKKDITAEAVKLTALEQRADPWTTKGKRADNTCQEGELSTAKDCVGEKLIEGKGLIALKYLDEALQSCKKEELWAEASDAALGLANMYGAMDKTLSRNALIMAQSMSAREDLTKMFLDNAAPTDREAIFMRLRSQLASNRVEASSSRRFVAASNFLDNNSVAWRMLNTSASVPQLLQGLPAGVQVVVWHMHKLPEPQLFCTVLASSAAAADGAPAPSGVTVYRASPGETQAMLQLNAKMAQLHVAQRVQLYKAGKLSEGMCGQTLELRAEMNSMFAPVMECFDFKGAHAVLVGPEQLNLVPLERLDGLEKGFQSVSMDISTHLLHARVAAQGEGEIADVSLDVCNFVLDCKNESDSLCPLISTFEQMRKPLGMTKWDGRSGSDHAVTQGEWQQVLLQASDTKQAAIFYGLGKCLEQLEPSSLMGLDLSGMPMMILLDRVENDKAYQSAVREEFGKFHCRQQAETAFGTAALLSLRGVSTVMLNRGPTGFAANQTCFKSLLELKGGASKVGAKVAQVLRQVVSESEEPIPRPQTKASSKASKGKASSRATTAASEAVGAEAEIPKLESTGMSTFCLGLGFLGLK